MGFNVPDLDKGLFGKVDYISELIPWPEKLTQEFIRESYFSKYYQWGYESEIRVFVKLRKPSDNLYFEPFDEDLQLCEIVIGARNTDRDKKLKDALSNNPQNGIQIKKARRSYEKFEMVRDEQYNVQTW